MIVAYIEAMERSCDGSQCVLIESECDITRQLLLLYGDLFESLTVLEAFKALYHVLFDVELLKINTIF